MDCEHIKEQLTAFAEDDLESSERLAVEKHLASCFLCREELDEIRETLDLCQQAVRHPNPSNRFEALRRDIATVASQERFLRHHRKLRFHSVVVRLATAAVVLVVFGLSTPLVEASRRMVAPLEYARTTQEASFPRLVPVVSQAFVERSQNIESRLEERVQESTDR